MSVDPVCGTCRKKSRKCDRTRPTCRRCANHGLVCEGYQLNIQMYGMKNGALRKTRSAKIDCEIGASVREAAEDTSPSTTTSGTLSAIESATSTSKVFSPPRNELVTGTGSSEADQEDLLLYCRPQHTSLFWRICPVPEHGLTC